MGLSRREIGALLLLLFPAALSAGDGDDLKKEINKVIEKCDEDEDCLKKNMEKSKLEKGEKEDKTDNSGLLDNEEEIEKALDEIKKSGDEEPPPAENPASSSGRRSRGSRGRRAAAAPPPSAAPPEAAARTRSRTIDRANKAADALRQGFRAAEELPEGSGPAAQAEARAPAPLERRAPVSPGEPVTPQDLMLASISGFGASFASLGLKVASGPGGSPMILRADGQPASQGELAALKARIEGEPKALMRRPDFFSVLSRDEFLGLKDHFVSRPELKDTSFKDITLTQRQRDFLWSASCDQVSGGCNKNAGESSYHKGDDVSPEDLKSIWDEVNVSGDELESGELSDGERKEFNAELAARHLSGGRRGPRSLGSLLDGLSSAADGAVSFFGAMMGDSGAEAPSVETGLPGAGAAGKTIAGAAAARRAAGPVPAAPAAAAARRSRWPLWAGLAGGAALILFGLIRRRG